MTTWIWKSRVWAGEPPATARQQRARGPPRRPAGAPPPALWAQHLAGPPVCLERRQGTLARAPLRPRVLPCARCPSPLSTTPPVQATRQTPASLPQHEPRSPTFPSPDVPCRLSCPPAPRSVCWAPALRSQALAHARPARAPPSRPGNPSSAPPRPHYLFDRGAIADHDLLLVLGGLDGDPNGGPRLGPARLRHAAAAATRPPASPLRLLLLLLPARPAGPARLGSGASNTPLPSLSLGFTAPSGPAAATAPRADWGGHCSGVRPGPSPGSRSRVWAPGRLGAGAGRAPHCAGAGRAPAGALGPSRRARAVPRSTPAQSGPCPLRGSLPLRDKGLCVAALSPFRAIAGLSRETQLLPRLGLLPTGG